MNASFVPCNEMCYFYRFRLKMKSTAGVLIVLLGVFGSCSCGYEDFSFAASKFNN